jgi:hypothetical protein
VVNVKATVTVNGTVVQAPATVHWQTHCGRCVRAAVTRLCVRAAVSHSTGRPQWQIQVGCTGRSQSRGAVNHCCVRAAVGSRFKLAVRAAVSGRWPPSVTVLDAVSGRFKLAVLAIVSHCSVLAAVSHSTGRRGRQWPIQVGGTGHRQSQYGPGSRQSRSRAAVSHTGSTACSQWPIQVGGTGHRQSRAAVSHSTGRS